MTDENSEFRINSEPVNVITPGKLIEKQEKTRSYLAIGFSIGYGILIILFVIIIVFTKLSPENSNLLTVLLSGSTGFVGTILGFYFGQNSK